MKCLFFLLNLFVLTFSYGQKASSLSDNYKFFINYSDSLLKAELLKDSSSYYDYYKEVERDSLAMTDEIREDSLSLLNKQWYVGKILFPMQPPMYCELYKVNLQGSEDEEFVGLLSMAQPMGGSSFIFVFDTKNNGYRPLGQIELCSFRNPCLVSFKKLLDDKCYEILATSDFYRSVYMTEGLRILHLENNTFYESLEVATLFMRDDIIESKQVKFQDTGSNLKLEVIIESKVVKEKNPKKIISKSTKVFVWDPNKKKYVDFLDKKK